MSVVMVSLQERSEVRRRGREARQAIVGEQRAEREAALVAHLKSLRVLDHPSIGVFVAHDGEPDLRPLVDWLWARGHVVALPVVADDSGNRQMCFRTWSPQLDLVEGRYGIAVPPPDSSSTIEPACVLVSLTAFDSLGNRMGRGAGYFDRYLARATCDIVGVAFETQRVDQVPTASHDVAMPVMVTDLGVRLVS